MSKCLIAFECVAHETRDFSSLTFIFNLSECISECFLLVTVRVDRHEGETFRKADFCDFLIIYIVPGTGRADVICLL